jgi:hypothetical protein
MAVCQNLVPLVNIKIAGKWMFIPLKMVLIGIDPYPYKSNGLSLTSHRKRPFLLKHNDLRKRPVFRHAEPGPLAANSICFAVLAAISLREKIGWA